MNFISQDVPLKRNQGGFSLVELAVALTVIGVLLAGVIKGNELIGNSRADRIIMDLQNYQAAVQNFDRTYGGLPGDLQNVSARLPECSAAPCNGNGNGDRQIGSDNPLANTIYGAGSEMRAFWMQLSKAGMVEGVSDYTGTNNVAGVAFPKTPLGGGYRAFYNPGTGTFPKLRTNMIRPSRELNGNAMNLMFTAKQAGRIDRKIDDGMPETGRILGTTTTNACNSGLNGSYPENTRAAKCNILYVLGR